MLKSSLGSFTLLSDHLRTVGSKIIRALELIHVKKLMSSAIIEISIFHEMIFNDDKKRRSNQRKFVQVLTSARIILLPTAIAPL